MRLVDRLNPGAQLTLGRTRTGFTATKASSNQLTAFALVNGAANRTYQRSTLTGGGPGTGRGTIPVTVTMSAPGAVYARTRAANDAILQPAWQAATSATTGVLNITGIDARLGWFYLDLSGDGQTWSLGSTLVAMGRVILNSGQSQAVRQFAKMPAYSGTNTSLGVTPSPNSSVFARYTDSQRTLNTPAWAVPADGGNYDSTFASEFLRLQVAVSEVNCALVGHAVGATAISTWQAGQTNMTDLLAVIQAVGGFEAFYWHLGSNDAADGTTYAAYQSGLTGVFNAVAGANIARGSDFEKYVTAMATRTSGSPGTVSSITTIRRASRDWSASNSATYLEPHDVVLEDSVHQGQPGNIVLARHVHRATYPALGLAGSDAGPSLAAASRQVGSGDVVLTTNLIANSLLTMVGAAAPRFSVFAAGDTATPLALASATPIVITNVASPPSSTITLRLDSVPLDTQELNVYALLHPDPSFTTAYDNMVYDQRVEDGLPRGRQIEPSLLPLVVAAPGSAAAFTDTFTAADGTSLAGRASDSGHVWTVNLGGFTVTSNRLSFQSGSSNNIAFSAYTPAANCRASALIRSGAPGNFGIFVLLRATATNTYYLFGYEPNGPSGSGFYISKTLSGTFTRITGGFAAMTLASGVNYNMAATANGSTLTLAVNGTTLITVTDTSISAAGRIGLRFASVSLTHTLDWLTAGNL